MGKTASVTRCAYKNCRNHSGKSLDISFFRFPKDADRCTEWVNACGQEKLRNLTSEELYNRYRICQDHFENTHLNDLKNRLLSHACPKAHDASSTLQTHERNILFDYGLLDHDYTPFFVEICTTSNNNRDTQTLSANNDFCSKKNNETNESHYLAAENLIILYNQASEDQIYSKTVATQTDSSLSRNTPRKVQLRKEIYELKKELERFRKSKEHKSKKS